MLLFLFNSTPTFTHLARCRFNHMAFDEARQPFAPSPTFCCLS